MPEPTSGKGDPSRRTGRAGAASGLAACAAHGRPFTDPIRGGTRDVLGDDVVAVGIQEDDPPAELAEMPRREVIIDSVTTLPPGEAPGGANGDSPRCGFVLQDGLRPPRLLPFP